MGDADDFALQLDPAVADLVLLQLELDFGMTMADLALRHRDNGTVEEYERFKAHALDALVGVVATVQRRDDVDEVSIARQAYLAMVVAAL